MSDNDTSAPAVPAKFITTQSSAVEEAVVGHCLVNPHVVRLAGTHVVALREVDTTRVAIICGGGSGHEPAHIGFVHSTCLAAAVCGQVFASPPTSHVTAAINYLAETKGCSSAAGILVIVKNYTGDVINFGCAVKAAKCRGIKIEMVVVGDDVAFGANHDGRRGIAGTVVHYQLLACYAQQRNMNLSDLMKLSGSISSNLRSIGVSLSSCSLPGSAPNKVFAANEMEIGLGIHGEPGRQSAIAIPAPDVAAKLLDMICSPSSFASTGDTDDNHSPDADAANNKGENWADTKSSPSFVVLLNNLGATTNLEMSIMTSTIIAQLRQRFGPSCVAAVSCGRFVTALNMHGMSVSLVRLPAAPTETITAFDHVSAVELLLSSAPLFGFSVPVSGGSDDVTVQLTAADAAATTRKNNAVITDQAELTCEPRRVLTSLFTKLRDRSERFNELDAVVGDGDTGHGLRRACDAVLRVLPSLQLNSPPLLFDSIATMGQVVADAFAGTSGPLYGVFLICGAHAAAAALAESSSSADAIRAAFKDACAGVQDVGGAQRGDRTMVDVLLAVCDDFALSQEDTNAKALLERMHVVAVKAAAAVAQLPAKKGRSRYLGGKEVGCKDPGSELVVEWLGILAEEVQ